MNEFNLKKRDIRRKAYFDKNNFITKNGSDLIKNKLKFISKKIENCLIVDEDLGLDISNFSNTKIENINNINFVEGKFDAVISNFSLQIPLFLNSNEILKKILSKLNNNSLFCFNIVTSNSMRTLQNIFLEIDEKIDMVEVFRKSEAVFHIAKDAMRIGSKVLWTQLGIVDEQAALMARQAGLEVIMNKCPKIELQK